MKECSRKRSSVTLKVPNNLLSCNQHGFRKGCSCFLELLSYFHHIFENLGKSLDSDTIYLDFSKAFDKVDHALLIKKLQRYGIKGKLLAWIKCFLTDRVQKVVIDGKHSKSSIVISGVPQGTVLGPLLFILFLNDMNLAINYSKLKMFADDSRLIKAIHPCDAEEDQTKVDSDLQAVLKWSLENNMCLNEKKFQLISHHVHHLAPNLNMRLLLNLPFTKCLTDRSYALPNNVTLIASDTVVDLGISISNNFSFDTHICQISKKAHLKCNWILSVFQTRDPAHMMTLFKSLVLSIVEYCSPLWSPDNINEISMLESVQRRFTSKIYSFEHLCYWDRLKFLNLMSLQRRHERFQILYLWKIINDKVQNDIGVVWRLCPRKGIVISIPSMPSSVAKINSTIDRSFKVKSGKLWNCIPKLINTKTSLATFKNLLDPFLMGIPDCPPVSGYSTANNNSILDWLSNANAF